MAPDYTQWTMSDGYVVRGRVWRGTTSRAVLYLHGIQSHGGWYEWSASLLAAAGLTVVMPDRRGSGLNGEARGDVSDSGRWLADVDEIAQWTARHRGARRVAVVGVSWGGKLAVAWAARQALVDAPLPGSAAAGARARPKSPGAAGGDLPAPASLLLLAPGVFPLVGLGFVDVLAIGAALLTAPQQQFELPLNDAALFTNNPAGRAYIDGDPLKLTHATARFLYLSRRLDRALAHLGAGAIETPTTLVLSGDDRIIRNDATRRWAERVFASPRMVELPGAPHTLEFEADAGPFRAILDEWAGQQLVST